MKERARRDYRHDDMKNSRIRGMDFQHMTPAEFVNYIRRYDGHEYHLIMAWEYFANTATGSFADRVMSLMERKHIKPHVLPDRKKERNTESIDYMMPHNA
jgi:hypothetical protein